MIIDFTRNFTDEEYKAYCHLFDKWWEYYDQVRYDDACDEEDPNYDDYYVTYPETWIDLLEQLSNLPDYDSNDTRTLLLQYDRLCDLVNTSIKHFKEKNQYVCEMFWPDSSSAKTSILLFLNDRDMQYALINHPHPLFRDILLLPMTDNYREFNILFKNTSPTEIDFKWLVDQCGWRAQHRLDRNSDIGNWLNDSCSGRWRAVNDKLYFEDENDLIFYKLTFVASEDV